MLLLLFGGKTNKSYRMQSVKGYTVLSTVVTEKRKGKFVRGGNKRNGWFINENSCGVNADPGGGGGKTT